MTGVKMLGTLSFGGRMISRKPSSGVFEGIDLPHHDVLVVSQCVFNFFLRVYLF
jgi:hypothetical protein